MERENRLYRPLDITERSLESVIQVGNLFVRPKEIQRHLGRYAQRFVSYTGEDIYQFQHLGTATGIKYRGKYLTISTEHQRKLGAEGRLGIFASTGQSVITPSRIWQVEPRDHSGTEDNLDFAIYEFEPQNHPNLMVTSQFFEISENYGISSTAKQKTLNIGYPTVLQNVDYYAGEVDLILAANSVELTERTNSDDIYTFRTQNPDRYFSDGMSGSPVFAVVKNNDIFYVKWLGIVIRGGQNSRVGRVIDAKFIIRTIDRETFNSPPR